MNTRISSMAVTLAVALAGAVALSGCIQSSPRFDSGFGNSVRSSLAAQVADPGAAGNTRPVVGIDGRAAAAAVGRYEQSYAQPTAQQSLVSGQTR